MKNRMKIVKQIIEEVKNSGDKAVRKYTEVFDKVELASFKIARREIKEAYGKIDGDALRSLKWAARNIRDFARAQKKQFRDFEYIKNGAAIGQKVIPIERVGVYVPGGNYPLPSTALMCVIPARVAGVKKIIVCSPKIKSITIVAANLAGADAIFNIGGVQAIAAMAYGTKTVPRVDKIVGPGNIYVTGTAGADADTTYQPDAVDEIRINGLTASRVYTIGNSGAAEGSRMRLITNVATFPATVRRADLSVIGDLQLTVTGKYRWLELVFVSGQWELSTYNAVP